MIRCAPSQDLSSGNILQEGGKMKLVIEGWNVPEEEVSF
jgi:hypothetical protein